jgi:hypothetical protein
VRHRNGDPLCHCSTCADAASWNEIAAYLRSLEPPSRSGGLWYGDGTAVEAGGQRTWCGRADLEKLDNRREIRGLRAFVGPRSGRTY